MTQAQLDRSVARSTGESPRTVRRLGFSALPDGPADPHPEALFLVIDCPRCRQPAPYPGQRADGTVRAVSDERNDLAALGRAAIRRASHVEPAPDGSWHADLSPVSGPVLGPFARRGEALAAEVAWLQAYRLAAPDRAAPATPPVRGPGRP